MLISENGLKNWGPSSLAGAASVRVVSSASASMVISWMAWAPLRERRRAPKQPSCQPAAPGDSPQNIRATPPVVDLGRPESLWLAMRDFGSPALLPVYTPAAHPAPQGWSRHHGRQTRRSPVRARWLPPLPAQVLALRGALGAGLPGGHAAHRRLGGLEGHPPRGPQPLLRWRGPAQERTRRADAGPGRHPESLGSGRRQLRARRRPRHPAARSGGVGLARGEERPVRPREPLRQDRWP